MADPRNVAHAKKVMQEKKHEGWTQPHMVRMPRSRG
jgi:hypothetical protein